MKKYTEKWGVHFLESLCWGFFYFCTFKCQQLPNSLKCSNLYDLIFFLVPTVKELRETS